MPNEDVLEQIAKSNEGVMLGLTALAEYLRKQDEKEKEEEEEEDEKLEKEAIAMEKASLVKEITQGVIAALKQGGMDVDGKSPKAVSGKDTWPMSGRPAAEDQESPVTLRTATDEVQKPIQAMQKHLMNQVSEPGMEEEEVVPPVGPGMEEEEGSEEYPVEEDEFKEYPEQMKMLAKELKSIRKSLATKEQEVETRIQKGIEEHLNQLGYRKELSTRPINKGLFGAEETQIMKSSTNVDEFTDQLAGMTYLQLEELRQKVMSGQTEGIPREFIGLRRE